MTLFDLPLAQPAHVDLVRPDPSRPDLARELADIGFLPGERVQVLRRSLWGGDPLVVRVGLSCFALRRAEAACVQVQPLPTGGAPAP